MPQFGRLKLPSALLDRDYSRGLLHDYFQHDDAGWVYSGALFNTYPADPLSGMSAPPSAANKITDGDLIALSMLGIRVTGYQALAIRQDLHTEIDARLTDIPPDARIEDEASVRLLARDGPAWTLWELLRDVKDRTKEARFGAVAAGKL